MLLLSGLCLIASTLALREADLKQAQQRKPRAHLLASNPSEIRSILNKSLKNLFPEHYRPCSNFSFMDLSMIENELNDYLEPDLNSIYMEAQDSRRLLGIGDLKREAENEAKGDGETLNALRGASCAGVAMKIVHHISEVSRQYLARTSKLVVPLLPEKGSEQITILEEKGKVKSAAYHHKTLSCETGHNATMIAAGEWRGWPDWPDEFSYEGRGFGAYPFWYGTSPDDDTSGKTGSEIFTEYSAIKNAERISHGNCNLASLGGPESGPCYNLFTGYYAYLYTPDKSFCCYESKKDYSCAISKPQRDFWNIFDYNGISYEYETLSPGYYSGPVHNYTLVVDDPLNGPFWFWYYTDMENRPIEQGEGSCVGPRYCLNPLPFAGFTKKYVFHEFNTSSITQTSFDWDTFDVPEICLNTTTSCMIGPPDGNFVYCDH